MNSPLSPIEEKSNESLITPPVSDESFKVASGHSEDEFDQFERPRIKLPDDDVLYAVAMMANN